MNRKPSLISMIIAGAFSALGFAWPMAAKAQAAPQVEISAKDCRRLADAAKTGADYVPGVDARGKKIKSADVEGQPRIKLPDILSFSLDKDLSAYGASKQTSVGVIFFDTVTGVLTYNGQPLNAAARDELTIKCRRLL